MAILNFREIDRKEIEKYCKENREILSKTGIKERCLGKHENWYYFFTALKNQPELREYIKSTLRRAPNAIDLAVIYLLISEKSSEEEKFAIELINRKLQSLNNNGGARVKLLKSLKSCPELVARFPSIE